MPDLITIPGFAELQALTHGDSRIKIAVLDGPADLDRACFWGANLSRLTPFWQQKLEPIDPMYYDLRNLGQLDRDRALNFAATNAFQAATTFAEALERGMALDTIEVEKSPLCRLNSNCWDIKLKFFDSENSRRAKKVYRFTIDVANIMPVTLGQVRSWSVPR